MKISYKKGFTLVEIMIVVAIIGIIIAIAVPAFLRARENARSRACQENLSKIEGSKEQYALDNKLSAGASAPDWSALVLTGGTGYLKTTPTCPGGGSYTIGTYGEAPTCNYTAPAYAKKHSLTDMDGAGTGS